MPSTDDKQKSTVFTVGAVVGIVGFKVGFLVGDVVIDVGNDVGAGVGDGGCDGMFEYYSPNKYKKVGGDRVWYFHDLNYDWICIVNLNNWAYYYLTQKTPYPKLNNDDVATVKENGYEIAFDCFGSISPTPSPSTSPSSITRIPSRAPTAVPTNAPSPQPTPSPTPAPTSIPTSVTTSPSKKPTSVPTIPTTAPTVNTVDFCLSSVDGTGDGRTYSGYYEVVGQDSNGNNYFKGTRIGSTSVKYVYKDTSVTNKWILADSLTGTKRAFCMVDFPINCGNNWISWNGATTWTKIQTTNGPCDRLKCNKIKVHRNDSRGINGGCDGIFEYYSPNKYKKVDGDRVWYYHDLNYNWKCIVNLNIWAYYYLSRKHPYPKLNNDDFVTIKEGTYEIAFDCFGSISPTPSPSTSPTLITNAPSKTPTSAPTHAPTPGPSPAPTPSPTSLPTSITISPTKKPTLIPTIPTTAPTVNTVDFCLSSIDGTGTGTTFFF